MKKSNSIILFNQKQVRRAWDENKELWYFSIIDVIEVLTETSIPKRYWSDLKIKLKNEGSQVYEKIVQLKFTASDGKKYATDCFSTEDLLRVIQSIPSPKAEPFKLWLAQVGYERMEEMEDPELSFDRAMKTYLQKGYSEKWVNQRLKSIEVRKDLVAEWGERGIKENSEYAILTDEITKAWAKGKSENRRFSKQRRRSENVIEFVLNMLAEASTTEISKKQKPKGLESNKQAARAGGIAAKKARLEIEKQTGEGVVTARNAKVLQNKQRNFLPNKK